jgi:hypothetical protein
LSDPDLDPDPGHTKMTLYRLFSMCVLLFNFLVHEYTSQTHFPQKIAEKTWKKNLFRSGSGRFQKSDMDPGLVKNRPNSQHCIVFTVAFILNAEKNDPFPISGSLFSFETGSTLINSSQFLYSI